MKDKRGVSEIISYVLLVVIAISLSILVYSWMKTQLPKPAEECPESISLVISDYKCDEAKREINLSLRNKGLFNIDGFIARISNTSESLAIHYLKSKEMTENFFSPELKPNEESSRNFDYSEYNRIEKIEIQPFVFEEKIILCNALSQKIDGCGSVDVKCIKSCQGKQCGDDGCGGSCGSCVDKQKCENGKCVSGCVNECPAGQQEKLCENETKIKTRNCGNYDFDNCLEWSNWSYVSCEVNKKCLGGICVETIAQNLTCSDGTIKESCSVIKPLYCNSKLQIVNNCSYCSCPSGLACQNENCVKTCNLNEKGLCEDTLDNDCDGEIDYDSRYGNHGDSDCPVEVLDIKVSDLSPKVNLNIEVECKANAVVNSIVATIENEKCAWLKWEGNVAKFSCNVGSTLGNKKIKCDVDTLKSYKSGTEKTTTINVMASECSSYANSAPCETDSRCDWCTKCIGNKYTGNLDRCVNAGNCPKAYCWKGECGAVCDETQGGCSQQSICDLATCSCKCIPKTCLDLKKACGTWANGCGEEINCGLCTEGEECQEGVCIKLGVVAYYKFDESPQTHLGVSSDSSAFKNHGKVYTNEGAINKAVSGKLESALSFDGRDDYVEISGNHLDLRNKITMFAWVYFKGEGKGNHIIISKKYGNSLQYAIGRYSSLDANSHKFFVGLYAGSWKDYSSDYVLENNKWYYLAATYDRQNVKFYVNGVLVKSIKETSEISGNNDRLTIGADANFPSWNEFTNAIIDEVKIYNKVLTEEEIKNIYKIFCEENWKCSDWVCKKGKQARVCTDLNNCGTEKNKPEEIKEPSAEICNNKDDNCNNLIDENLIGCEMKKKGVALYYNFDANPQTHSGIVEDNSGNNNHGTFYTKEGTINKAVQGKKNSALSFDGVDDYVTIRKETNLITGANDFTISGWINLKETNKIQNLLAWKNNNFGSIQFMAATGDGKIGMWACNKMLMSVPYSYTTNTWYHVAFVRNSNIWKVFVNGNQVGSDISDSCDLGNPTLNYHIGSEATAPSQFFNGIIDEFAIFNRGLSASEVKEIYEKGIPCDTLKDDDKDGYSSLTSCVGSKNDCNDNDKNINIGKKYYKDLDKDGYGLSNDNIILCAGDREYSALIGGDCNDNSANINPVAKEVCNGVDDNCDGKIDENLNNCCDGKIVNFLKDNLNCGKCGKVCKEEEVCKSGKCALRRKNLLKYSDDMVFLIEYNDKEKNWKDVLSLVPVAVWSEGAEIKKYPMLIYFSSVNREDKNDINFDVDSTISFMQQYRTKKAILVGSYPQELEKILVAQPDFGAGLTQENIIKIGMNDLFSFWKNFEEVLYVEDNYGLALFASTYASLTDTPLVIKNSKLDNEKIFAEKKVICVGNVEPTQVSCSEKYTLEQLQKKYAEITNTDKMILVNINDESIGLGPQGGGSWPEAASRYPTKKTHPLIITKVFRLASLAAPILASGKHELLVSTDNSEVPVINPDGSNDREIQERKNYVNNIIETKDELLTITPQYLTIVASPKAIPDSEHYFYDVGLKEDDRQSLDQFEYSDNSYKGNAYTFKTARIYGLVVTDVSSYIARALFYDRLFENTVSNYKLLSLAGPIPGEGWQVSRENAREIKIKTKEAGYESECYTTEGTDNCLYYESYATCAQWHKVLPGSEFKDRQFIIHMGHTDFYIWSYSSLPSQPGGLMHPQCLVPKELKLSFISSDGCHSLAFYKSERVFNSRLMGEEKRVLYWTAPAFIRLGAIAAYGNPGLGRWEYGSYEERGKLALRKLTSGDGKDIGTLALEMRDYKLPCDKFKACYTGRYGIMLGDPTIKPKFKQVNW